MESYRSINPYTEEEFFSYELHSKDEVELKLNQAYEEGLLNGSANLEKRVEAILNVAEYLASRKMDFAESISLEMGKVLREAASEIEKCIWLCKYYADNAAEFLKEERLELGEDIAIRRYEPLGVLLGVMPWNFPFWQVFRFAIPAILAGNRIIVKHAPNCPHSAELIEEAFHFALEESFYQNVRLTHVQVAHLLNDPRIKALSLTGSTRAGKEVAQIAAKNLKPQVLELGGSNAFLLLEDADPSKAAKLAARARLLNAGQSCIAAKRFIVPKDLLPYFREALITEFKKFLLGDPLDPKTDIGPLARPDLAQKVEEQIQQSIAQGAKLWLGGKRERNFIEPSILEISTSDNTAFQDEVFGPVAVIIAYESLEEAIELSNISSFGLGISLIGNDLDKLLELSNHFEEGAVFINELVKSDPRLPFGGVKDSGYGRELGPEGIRSFTNLKTIYIKRSL